MFFADAGGVPAPLHLKNEDGSERKADGVTIFDLPQAVARFGLTDEQLRTQYLRTIADIFGQGRKPTARRKPRAKITDAEYDEVRRRMMFPELDDLEYRYVVGECSRRGLDLRHVFVKKVWQASLNKLVPKICTTVEAMRLIAMRTREYIGLEDVQFLHGDKREPLYATATVIRRIGQDKGRFVGRAVWAERAPAASDPKWVAENAETYLKRCAVADALREGFPEECGSLYITEEFGRDNGGGGGGTPAAPAPPAPWEDPDTAMDKGIFNRELMNMGLTEEGKRVGVRLQFQSRWPDLYRRDEAEFYRRVLREVRRAPKVYGAAVGEG